jgi:hypothetical protein
VFLVPDIKARPGPGRIVIKNLKFSSVYEETVRQVEEQAKLKAERYEEGELSEDSSDNKGTSPIDDDPLLLSPGNCCRCIKCEVCLCVWFIATDSDNEDDDDVDDVVVGGGAAYLVLVQYCLVFVL